MNEDLNESFKILSEYENNQVDIYRDWLIVSDFKLVDNLVDDFLHTEKNDYGQIQIIKAEGYKCDRCWHYSKETLNSEHNTKLCKRCADIVG